MGKGEGMGKGDGMGWQNHPLSMGQWPKFPEIKARGAELL